MPGIFHIFSPLLPQKLDAFPPLSAFVSCGFEYMAYPLAFDGNDSCILWRGLIWMLWNVTNGSERGVQKCTKIPDAFFKSIIWEIPIAKAAKYLFGSSIVFQVKCPCETCKLASAEEDQPRRLELALTLFLSNVKNSRTAPLPTRNAFSINATIFSNRSQLSWHTTGVPRWLAADSVLTTTKCFPWSQRCHCLLLQPAGGFKDVV